MLPKKQLKTSGQLRPDGTIDAKHPQVLVEPLDEDALQHSARLSTIMTPNFLAQRGIYKRFAQASFQNIEKRGLPDDENIRQNYSQVKNYANQLTENMANGIGLILMGPCGTLKTMMAVAVLRKRLENGGSGMFIPMCSLLDDVFTRYTLNREEWARYEQKIRNTSLLVLDDLGSENSNQKWVMAKVDSIITERYNKMLPCIITTNMDFKEMKGTYAERIIDRFRSTSITIMFTGKSQREDARASEKLYFGGETLTAEVK